MGARRISGSAPNSRRPKGDRGGRLKTSRERATEPSGTSRDEYQHPTTDLELGVRRANLFSRLDHHRSCVILKSEANRKLRHV